MWIKLFAARSKPLTTMHSTPEVLKNVSCVTRSSPILYAGIHNLKCIYSHNKSVSKPKPNKNTVPVILYNFNQFVTPLWLWHGFVRCHPLSGHFGSVVCWIWSSDMQREPKLVFYDWKPQILAKITLSRSQVTNYHFIKWPCDMWGRPNFISSGSPVMHDWWIDQNCTVYAAYSLSEADQVACC